MALQVYMPVSVGKLLATHSLSWLLRPCLLPPKNTKFFKILRHIESLDACMEY